MIQQIKYLICILKFYLNMKPQKTENQRFASEIRDILVQIDKLMEEKSLEKDINFQSLGSIMEESNQQFYKSGIELGKFGFSTLATEKENKRELAMTFLSSIYSNWRDEQKEIYNILEIGAGSGDLMLEIFTIKDEVLSNPSSSEMHKKFFNSLKFNIFDFEEMNRLQREKLGEKSSKVNFISGDISKDLLPANKFDFVYGNEIPDTQRLEFLEVKTDEKTCEKKFFLRAIKTTKTGEKNEVLINLKSSPKLVEKIEENLLPISDLGDGIYKLQFGFHSLMHNIKQSLTEYGGLMLVDYFNFDQKHSIRDLTFASTDGSTPEETREIIQTGEPGKQIILAQELYGNIIDITYGPNVGFNTLEKFTILASKNNDDNRKNAIYKTCEMTQELLTDPLFGKYLQKTRVSLLATLTGIQKSELSECRRLKDIPSEYLEPASTQTSKAIAKQVGSSVYYQAKR